MKEKELQQKKMCFLYVQWKKAKILIHVSHSNWPKKMQIPFSAHANTKSFNIPVLKIQNI